VPRRGKLAQAVARPLRVCQTELEPGLTQVNAQKNSWIVTAYLFRPGAKLRRWHCLLHNVRPLSGYWRAGRVDDDYRNIAMHQ
jgi:hypothetical protein